MNGSLLTHNTSHYTLITEYKFDYFYPDKVRSTLNISNVTTDISGTYTCWCEYNQLMIYGNEMFRSNTFSVFLEVISGKYLCNGS